MVVPTPDWVWRVGTMATAPLNEPNPERLALLLRRSLPNRDLLLVSTQGQHKSTERLADILALQHRAKVAQVRLPVTATAATRNELKSILRAAAANQGFVVSFKKEA